MFITETIQALVFLVLMFDTVRMLPLLNRMVTGKLDSPQPGFDRAIAGARITRNLMGLALVPMVVAGGAAQPYVPAGIVCFVALALVHAALCGLQRQVLTDWREDGFGAE